ncbi:MAG TPA: ABC transporter transmembrane domain-containing protein, partial [Ardenticatenaceae bacterium]|nr:ABC transporter transmembrane domain-containing protein [Ardenticatenaceae bacterium]
ALNTELEEVAERERLKKKLSSDRLYVENAVARLASVFESGSEAVFLGDDIGDDVEEPLFTACRLVGTALGVEMRPRPDPIDGRAEAQTLDGIARASRVRTRQVALRGEWWRQDNGPLLAFTEDGKRPVALLPASPRRYELLDPMAQSRTPVTREVADTLEPFAHSFYRTFPERLLTTRDLIELGLRGAGRDLATIVLTGIAGGVLALLVPVATGVIFDSLIPAAERAQLVQLSLALIVSALTAAAFQVVRSVAVLRLEGRIDTSIQAAVWDRLLSLPVPFFRDYSAGDLAVRAMGINTIRQTLTGATLSTLLSAVFSIFSFGLLFVYSVRLALVATALVLVYVALATTAGYVQVRYQRRIAEIEGRLSGMVLQFLSGISKLRVAGAEGRAFARWADEFSDKRKLAFRARAVGNRVAVLNAAYPVLATLIIFVMVVLSGGAGLSTGSFLAFNAAFVQFMAAMLAVSSSAISILGVVPHYERAKPILHTRPEVDRAKADPGELSGEIEVSHVSFRYAPDTPLILKNVSLRINPGEFVALVGPSGSGKSTLFRLLLGFETPESGAVYYN